ncbi:rmpB-like protein [Burkholderia pseudomallei]|nr:rmpB-like protein [Burkholderia pseudomallei 1710b]AIS47879.1 transposase family protein [Burkholderia pseudomallei]KGD16774.1 transposase family protein [Burkholderia pseudomallei]CAJ2963678.1 rmpB-like protein [Burkholderia pseudomallei]CAJ3044475.1 rmpB-like protein [Burkholderia pseudomallei]
MDTIRFLAIDLAKNVFQVHGLDAAGKLVLRRRVGRAQLTELVLRLAPCTIGMEACSSAHHWARQFLQQGHTVKLISPQFVKPFVKGNKTDGNDAEAICEALQRPSMRFVPIKSVEQQDVQSLHRARSRLVSNRTGLVSQMRGILAERGIVLAQSITRARREIPVIVADTSNALTPLAREMLADLMDQLRELDRRIAGFDRRIDLVFKARKPVSASRRLKGLAPRRLPPSLLQFLTQKTSGTADTLLPGSVLFPVRVPAETERTYSASASEATGIYAPCSYTVLARYSEPHQQNMTRNTPGRSR